MIAPGIIDDIAIPVDSKDRYPLSDDDWILALARGDPSLGDWGTNQARLDFRFLSLHSAALAVALLRYSIALTGTGPSTGTGTLAPTLTSAGMRSASWHIISPGTAERSTRKPWCDDCDGNAI